MEGLLSTGPLSMFDALLACSSGEANNSLRQLLKGMTCYALLLWPSLFLVLRVIFFFFIGIIRNHFKTNKVQKSLKIKIINENLLIEWKTFFFKLTKSIPHKIYI